MGALLFFCFSLGGDWLLLDRGSITNDDPGADTTGRRHTYARPLLNRSFNSINPFPIHSFTNRGGGNK